jgi:hypothetical protein
MLQEHSLIFNLPKIDEIRVIIKTFTGTVNGESRAALAEVETNARISFYEIIGVKQISGIAEKFSLKQNYPNPFNPVTNFEFQIEAYGYVQLVVYDILGKEVAKLLMGC